MRIVAGEFGGRKLVVPKGHDIRPTSDKVRGAVFNALQSRDVVDGARVLDCFCGTGALGLEALSRGATSCTFIDKARISLDLAKDNAANLGASERSDFFLQDASKISQAFDKRFSLVFLDPPYERNLLIPTLKNLNGIQVLEEGAVVVAEIEKSFKASLPSSFKVLDEKSYGDTKILFLNYASVPE